MSSISVLILAFGLNVCFNNVFFFFDHAGLYALQIRICSNKSRGELESNPGVPGQQRISPPLGLSNRALTMS